MTDENVHLNEYFYTLTIQYQGENGPITVSGSDTIDAMPGDTEQTLFWSVLNELYEENKIPAGTESHVLCWTFRRNTGLYRA